jgi:hypothetical protein
VEPIFVFHLCASRFRAFLSVLPPVCADNQAQHRRKMKHPQSLRRQVFTKDDIEKLKFDKPEFR